jgi:phage-related protein
MAKVASTQMGKVTKSIRGAMSQASSGVNVNVSRTVSTDYTMGRALSANALYAANNASTASLGGNMGTLASSASYAMSTGGNGTSGGSSRGEGQELHMHVNVDGRELARASARYIDNELKAMTKRENRKRGAK